jgi:2-hydroxycyclohexanecarboxyl-CoA dehydrogenase
MRGLKDKVIVVTGGARGIGAALCRRFAAEAAKIAIFDVLRDDARTLAQELSADSSRARAFDIDITDYHQVGKVVAEVENELGSIEVLVNNAGVNRPAAFVESDPSHWQLMISNNLVGPLNMHRAVLSGMARRRRGRVVNIASDAGRVGSPNEAVYSACKGGIIAFSKAIAREVAPHQINVNVVCPGPTETALFRDVAGEGEHGQQFRARFERVTPLGRLGQPDDVAGAVCFLASDDAAFITGQVISVSGGLTMVG